MSYKSSLCKDAHRFYMGPGRPGKSWNFLFTFSWTGKSWKKNRVVGKPWKKNRVVGKSWNFV